MTEYKEIIIEWSESIDVEALIDSELEKKNVVYQIYGDHHIYGRDTLLYIGISINVDVRLKQHVKGVFGFVHNKKISIGKIDDFDGNLEIVESILIANHKPSYNKEFIHDLSPKAKEHKILVINNGHNGMLKTCCTNYWWIKQEES